MDSSKVLGFFAGRSVAEAEGLPRERANQLGLVTWSLGLTPVAVVVTQVIARREAEPLRVAPAEDAPSPDEGNKPRAR